MNRTETTTQAPYAVLNLRGQGSEEDLTKNRNEGPMTYNGSLEQYEVSREVDKVIGIVADFSSFAEQHFDVTPVIWREFAKDLQLVDLLEAENSEDLIRDLAVLSKSNLDENIIPVLINLASVSRRGVCFFRDQDISGEQLIELGHKIGQLSGRPAASGLHVHPLTEDTPELGSGVLAEISSDKQKKGGGLRQAFDDKSTYACTGWQYVACLGNQKLQNVVADIRTCFFQLGHHL